MDPKNSTEYFLVLQSVKKEWPQDHPERQELIALGVLFLRSRRASLANVSSCPQAHISSPEDDSLRDTTAE